MKEYIEYIITQEQLKLVKLIVSKYGEKGNFNENDIINKFINNRKLIETNDKFQECKKRGRPKKF